MATLRALLLAVLAACGSPAPAPSVVPARALDAATAGGGWPAVGRIECSLVVQDPNLRAILTYTAHLRPDSRRITAVVIDGPTRKSASRTRTISLAAGGWGSAYAHMGDIEVPGPSGSRWILALDVGDMALIAVESTALGWLGPAWLSRDCTLNGAG